MQIVFDNIIFSLQKSGGISVVWYELLTRLHRLHHLKPLFIDNTKAKNHYHSQIQFNDRNIIGKIHYPSISRYLSVNVALNEPFIFHSSYYRYCTNPKAINITTVHDFTYEFFRKGIQKKIHSWQKFKALRHSNYIVCVSKNTQHDLLNLFPEIDERKVRVIYNGVSDEYHRLPSSFDIIRSLPFSQHSYVLYIGDRSEYKNFPLCVKAVSQTNYNLVIVGKSLTNSEENLLKQHMPKERYRATGFITNEKLNILLNYAAALIYPSIYEGFGIPILEAQKAGCPVIACNNSSIPEVLSSKTLMMDNVSIRELVAKLKLLSNNDLIQEVRTAGIKHSKNFSWDKMATQYYNLYQELY